LKKITPYIGRSILKRAASEEYSYLSWMRSYLNPKEYYFLRALNYQNISIHELKHNIENILTSKGIEINDGLAEYLIRTNNRLGITLKIIRSGFLNNFKSNIFERNELFMQILSYRININRKLSIYGGELLRWSKTKEDNKFFIVAPVCPDYSYIYTTNGKYRYTFESIGEGIGLVAKKAIDNIKLINDLSKDLFLNNFELKSIILIGDFEANEKNLTALKETKNEFLRKVNLSREAIESSTGIETHCFSNLCKNLEGWDNQLLYLKHNYSLNSFDDLKKFIPRINHERNLISRLPLYKKWFGDGKDFKQIFFDQVVEYFLMSKLIYAKFGNNSSILASDHKAMRHYYGFESNVQILSSSANY